MNIRILYPYHWYLEHFQYDKGERSRKDALRQLITHNCWILFLKDVPKREHDPYAHSIKGTLDRNKLTLIINY